MYVTHEKLCWRITYFLCLGSAHPLATCQGRGNLLAVNFSLSLSLNGWQFSLNKSRGGGSALEAD